MKNLANLNNIVTLANIIVMVVLIIIITLQNRSSGLSSVFGGGGGIAQTRRGFEKWLFYATIVFAVLFIGLSIAHVLINK